MNSPTDPGSPISTDTESPPPEEIDPSSTAQFMNIASQITKTLVGSGAKRRLPGGSGFGASSSNRDPKSRRRGDPALSRPGGVGGALHWEGSKESKREERDFVDHNVVEYLRKEIGDPFQDAVVLKHA